MEKTKSFSLIVLIAVELFVQNIESLKVITARKSPLCRLHISQFPKNSKKLDLILKLKITEQERVSLVDVPDVIAITVKLSSTMQRKLFSNVGNVV